MNCMLDGHDYIYDIQTIIQIFFPNESFTLVKQIEILGLTAVSILALRECQGAIYSNGRLAQKSVYPLPEHSLNSAGRQAYTPVAAHKTDMQETRRRL